MVPSFGDTLKYLLGSIFRHRSKWAGDRFDYAFKKAVKAKYRNRCYFTGATKNLCIHHLHNVDDFPELRAAPANGVLIDEEIHKDFHKWNGGTRKKCTAAGFRKYIKVWEKRKPTNKVGQHLK